MLNGVHHKVVLITVPVSVDPPLVMDIKARSVQLEWQAPYQANGIITEYRLFANAFRRATVSTGT